jgi:hypothetical protein
MKSSPRLSLSSVMKRSFVTFGAACFVVLVLDAVAFAAIPVDIYVDFASGNAGDLTTPANLTAATHGASWSWSTYGTTWISNANTRNLPGSVTVGGVTYNGTGGTHTFMFNDNNDLNYVAYADNANNTPHPRVTIACYWTPGEGSFTSPTYRFDIVELLGWPDSSSIQIGNYFGAGPYVDTESRVNGISTFSSGIAIGAGKTYWVNMHWEGPSGAVLVAVFDPDNGFAQVGSWVSTACDVGAPVNVGFAIGRCDGVGDKPLTTQSYISNVLLDYTNAAFPLLPGATDTTPPSTPPTVRDGTGADISTTSSTTQLSANWDACSDPDSGIFAYQYAIGTTAGGTDVVAWTYLASNATTVTNTGLTLTVGQTYYFGVRAVNGAGLAGSATNSNGVTVVSGTDSTPPSAPPAVRDGTGADIAYTSSTTQLSANWDASTDTESGISGYQYAIGTTAGGTQTVNWTSLGNVTTVTKTGLSLTNGQTYFFTVKAVNGAGLTGNATNSNGQKVDSTAPSAPATVRDGTGTDISTTSSTTQLSANWDAGTDAESGISGYQYAIGTTAGGTQTVNWTSLGNVTTVTQTGLSLSVGQIYYFSVKAVNGAGLTGNATNSNGQTVVSGSSVTYFQDNFESWTAHGGAWTSVSGETSTHTLNTSTDYAKAGAKGLKLTDTDTTAGTGACLTKTFSPTISADVYVRFFVFFPTGFGSANSGCRRRLLRVWCGSNRGQMSFQNGVPIMEEVGSWGAASGSAVSENAWHCVEMHMATPSASTLMEFWIDGVKNSTTLNGSFSGSTTYDHIDFGDVALGAGSNGAGTFYLDEIVVSNSYVGTGFTSPVTYFQDDFESWTVHGGAWSSISGESSGHTLNTSTDQARSGSKSLKLTDTDSTGVNGAYLTKNFSPTISGDIYARFYVYLPSGYESANSVASRRLLRIFCGTNRSQMSVRGSQLIMEEVGAWGSAGGSTISESAWHCIEMHVTAPSATTLLEFWVDGTLNSTALMANFSASSTFDHVDLGDIGLSGGTNGNGTFYLDEAVVSNSYIGPLP